MKGYKFALFFLALAVILFGISLAVGTHTDENGFLIEPAFFCIPLGYLSLVMSVITAIVTRLKIGKKETES